MNEHEFKNVLLKYRDSGAPPSIQVALAVSRLMDSDDCQNLSHLMAINEDSWETRIATPNLMLPALSGIYMFVWKPNLCFRVSDLPTAHNFAWVLYVGKAGVEGGVADTIQNRYRNEYSKYVNGDPSVLWDGADSHTREARLPKLLSLRPLEYWFLPVTDKKEIPIIERKLIKFLSPPANQQYGPKVKLGKTEPAF